MLNTTTDYKLNNSDHCIPLQNIETEQIKIDAREKLFAMQESDFPLSLSKELKILTKVELNESEKYEKLTYIFNKLFSLEAQQQGNGQHLIEKLETYLSEQYASQKNDSLLSQIAETRQLCGILKRVITKSSGADSELTAVSKEWTRHLQQTVQIQTKRCLETTSKTLEDLRYLKTFLLDLSLPDEALRQLEVSQGELSKLVQLNSADDLVNAFKDLQAVHTQKQQLKKVAKAMEKALTSWEATHLAGSTIDVNAESPLCKEFGYKHGRLIQQSEFLQQALMPGVEVPIPRGVSNTQLHTFLGQYFPDLNAQWQSLNEGFRAFQNSKAEGLPDSAYLQQIEVKTALKQMEESIIAAFERAVNDPECYRQLSLSDMESWLKELKDKDLHLMVRSSGAEDTRQASNAGGNISVAYVEPERSAVCRALGKVVASYFGQASLQNRINSAQNPFEDPQHLAVSLQELIGERVVSDKAKSNSDESQIPISLVLFSNEPTYVGKEPFRIMRISATYGHGEGVVGAAGVRSDTITLLRSVKHPGQLYILEDIAAKPKRLAPVKDPETGEIKLEKVDNPPEMATRAALDSRLLTRLYHLGVTVENVYKHPMDMELVIRDGKIYPVQARPVNRPDANPTFLDLKKVETAKKKERGTWETFQAEPFLPGSAQAQILQKSENILICDTLENAEKQFKKGVHRLVVIQQEEPANSHPVINFCGMGIPVMYSREQDKLKHLANELNGSNALIACVQTGQFVLWKGAGEQKPENCISKGYTVHPARVVISVDHSRQPLVSQQSELPQEIKSLLMQVRALESQDAALTALKALKERLNETVATKREWLAEELKRDSTLPRAETLLQGINSWKSVVDQALSNLKKTVKLSPDGRLEPLFHAKVVESLMTQAAAPQALGRLSLINIDHQLQAVAKIADYRSKFDDPAQVQFSEEILLGRATMTPGQEKQWELFLVGLESAHRQQLISPAEIKRYRGMLKQLDDFELLPIWMASSFLPAIPGDLSALSDPKAAGEIMRKLLAEFPRDVSFFNTLEERGLEIDELSLNVGQFANPESFERALAQLHRICKPFISLSEMPKGKEKIHQEIAASQSDWKKLMESATPLEKIGALQLMGKLIDLYDGSIKSMKASQAYSEEEKVILFRKMLEGYFTLQADWLTHLSGGMLKYHYNWPLKDYLDKIEEIIKKSSNSPSELRAFFNVAAAVIGKQTAFERSLPTSLEDCFTLIHQNLLAGQQALLREAMHDKIILPESLDSYAKEIERQFADRRIERDQGNGKRWITETNRIQLAGYTCEADQLKLIYNYPLRNHSATFSIVFDKKTQECILDASFLGQARNRWEKVAHMLELYDAGGLVSLQKAPKVDAMSLSYSQKLPDKGKASLSFALLETAGDESMVQFLTDDQLIIPRQMEHDKVFEGLCKAKSTKIWSYFDFTRGTERLDEGTHRVPEELQSDKVFALESVKENGSRLIYGGFSQSVMEDEEIVLAAKKQMGWSSSQAFTKFPKALENNLPIVLEAVTEDGDLLKKAGPTARDNKEIVLAAVRDKAVIDSASPRLQDDADVFFAALPNDRNILSKIGPTLQKNKEIILAAASTWVLESLQSIADYEITNEQGILWNDDEEVVCAAVKKRAPAIRYASPRLKASKEFLIEIIKINREAARFFKKNMLEVPEIKKALSA